MEKKNKSANEYVNEAIVSLTESISLREAADEAMGDFQHLGKDFEEYIGSPILAPFWNKLELEEKAKELLISFMFDIKEPEYAYGSEEEFPQHALDCLAKFKETGNIDEIKKAYWYLRKYHDYENSIVL